MFSADAFAVRLDAPNSSGCNLAFFIPAGDLTQTSLLESLLSVEELLCIRNINVLGATAAHTEVEG